MLLGRLAVGILIFAGACGLIWSIVSSVENDLIEWTIWATLGIACYCTWSGLYLLIQFGKI